MHAGDENNNDGQNNNQEIVDDTEAQDGKYFLLKTLFTLIYWYNMSQLLIIVTWYRTPRY